MGMQQAEASAPNRRQDSQSLERWEIRLLLAGLILLGARLLISPLPSSFWLDETATVWAIGGSFHDLIGHIQVFKLFPQMPLYVMIAWLWSRVAGMSEVALRLPSVVTASLSAYLLYRLGRRLIGQTAATYSLILLLSISSFSFAATDARQYSWALLLLVITFYELQRWVETGRILHLILHGVASGLTLHFCYFFGAALAAQAVFVLIGLSRRWFSLSPGLILSPVLAIIILIPLAPLIRAYLAAGALHMFAARPSWTDLGVMLAPPRWMIAIVLATVLLAILGRYRFSFSTHSDNRKLTFVVCWALVPTFLLFLYSILSSGSVWVPRYLLGPAPGMALLGGYALSILQPVAWRLLTISILVVISFATSGTHLVTAHFPENWRAGLARVREVSAKYPDAPVLIGSGYVESGRLPLPATSEELDWMLSPLTAYPIGTSATMLPFEITSANSTYIQSTMETAARSPRVIALIPASRPLVQWVKGRFDGQFSATVLNDDPVVILFERRPGAGSATALP